MGSIPKLSIMRGDSHPLPHPEEEPHLLHRIFEQGLSIRDRSATAILAKDTILTYGQLDTLSSSLARSILSRSQSIGAQRNRDGDFVVAVSMAPSEQLIVTLLASWKAGAAYLPLDPSYPNARITHILNEAQPFIVVTDEEDTEVHRLCKVAFSYRELLNDSKEMSGTSIPDNETFTGKNTSLALVLYTSGSTGVPKGVRLSHRVLLNRLRWQWRVFPYASSERVCVFKTVLTFVDSFCEIWATLLSGRALLVVPSDVTRDPERLVHVLEQHKVERLMLVPSLLRSILLYLEFQESSRKTSDQTPLQALKVWVCSGEPLATELAAQFFNRFHSDDHVLCNFYGSTEVTDVTYHVLGGALSKEERIPIGVPIDNTVIYLLDKKGRPVVEGEVGELYVSGFNLAEGYVNGRDPDSFVSNSLELDPDYAQLFRTGDYACITNGVLMYEGRTDSQVKVRGHRVDLSEVEKAVNEVEGVEKGVVLCYKPGEVNQTLLAFATTDTNLLPLQIEATLQRGLAPYQVPQVIILGKIPLLVNGKVDRQSLLRSYEDTFKNGNEDDGGENLVELDYSGVSDKNMAAAQTLFKTIASVLSKSARSKLNVESNFYQLGGNSLNSIYTVTKLWDQGYIIGISDFIKARNLSEVISCMRLDTDEDDDSINRRSQSNPVNHYSTRQLEDSHKTVGVDMMATSFYEKGDLGHWLKPDIQREDYSEIVNMMWEQAVSNKLSFMVLNEAGEYVGVALNFDIHDEPIVKVKSKLALEFDFVEHLEGPIKNQLLPQEIGKVFHANLTATKETLSPQQNIEVMHFMEEQILQLAQEKSFEGIFTTNTNPLTQQLGESVYNYQTLLDYQVNQYIAPDGTKPFGKAPDSQRAVCSWKKI